MSQLTEAIEAYKARHTFCSHVPILSLCHLDDTDHGAVLVDLIHAIHWYPDPVPGEWATQHVSRTDARMSLVDDLADVLSRMVVGWEHDFGVNLAKHPDVQRVMARYRAERRAVPDDEAPRIEAGALSPDTLELVARATTVRATEVQVQMEKEEEA